MFRSILKLNRNSLNSIRLFSSSTNGGKFTISSNVDKIPNNEISNVEKLRKKLLYQSKERGMLENDLLLGSFATNNIQKLTEQQLKDYDLLLQQPDPDIFNWILNKTVIPDEFETEVLKMIQHHCQNDPLGYTRK
ncbi:hypothetical protein DICPUDRAFT_32960 [Dictyostelium purpureum]|uniref:Succinate dehydrogenase assembly factor 2, mitochondrial n=1 Tax=Dictyostelium purpureum TaxID=5786 RepID=F0ZJZ4_DICPU|nr:uncharacterized protein DICPUDRAFT_32960 [Dictyostelium purpureum]EGC35743.1 hypothetical protein DICPUDRAFT_32960 [Dictyostelium purpureum]|eukprot:XP_003287746.1 hypothetical protein DICPUDRAFT_32960 [Dictyostelium purpureum]